MARSRAGRAGMALALAASIGLLGGAAAIAGSGGVGGGGELRLRSAKAAPAKIYFEGRRRARFELEIAGSRPRDLVIRAIRERSGRAVRSWRLQGVKPGVARSVRWDGRRARGGHSSPGRHLFRVYERGGAAADPSRAGGNPRVEYYAHRFPLPGRHEYGDGPGSGRGHTGQDLLAKCGRPVLAARAGRVRVRGSHGAAGHHVVIRGRGTDKEYVYMHLQRGGRPREGTRVRTGERIGFNGASGNASTCHLHFELWSAPGWFNGGRALDPTKPLRKWDRWS